MNGRQLVPVGGVLFAALLVCGAHAAEFGADIVGKHGFTHASPQLQTDVNTMMHSAVPILVRRATGSEAAIACGKMLRTDTVVTHMTSSQRWSETWTYTVCATEIAVPIDFKPDGKGGCYFTVREKDVVARPAAKPI